MIINFSISNEKDEELVFSVNGTKEAIELVFKHLASISTINWISREEITKDEIMSRKFPSYGDLIEFLKFLKE